MDPFGSFLSVMFHVYFCYVVLPVLCSPSAGKGLTSWLACVLCFLVFFVTFPYGVRGQVWY